MARINPLHIDIPSVPSHLHMKKSSRSEPLSPSGMFNTSNTTAKEGAEEASFFSLTRNGFQYPDSPSSDISSPMMTPLPFKMMMPQPPNNNMYLLTPVTPAVGVVEKDDRKKLREYEFPSPAAVTSVAIKVEGSGIQPYQNHPFTQLRQQRQPSLQQQLPIPSTAKATPVLSYSAKYANFTNNSSTLITTTSAPQTVVRVSTRPIHVNNQDNDNSSCKPSTTMALSMIEKEKMAYQYPTHRVSMISPPPPPYISSSSPSLSDHGAEVGTAPATTTTTTTTATQSAASAAAVIAISPPLQQQVPDQHLTYDPTIIITPASLAAHTAMSKRHSLPVALSRSSSSSSATFLSSPTIIVAGSGITMSDMASTTSVAPRVFSPKASRDVKRHSLAVIPSSMSLSTSPSNSMPPRHNKTTAGLGHRGVSNMPPQAIPIFGSTGSAADIMEAPPTAFNPRSSFSSPSSTHLFERTTNTTDTEKDLSALIGPEHDHKNTLMSLSHTNITAHNNNISTLSSPPRMQGLLRIASLQRAAAAASAAERNLILSTSRIGGGMGPPERTEFPGFWEDAKQHNMHWTVYTIGLATVASLVWVLMLPTLMVFVPILPGAVVLLMGIQYSVYRWRRKRHYTQQLKDRRPSPAALSSMRAASAALTHSRSSSAVATAPSSPQFHAFSPNHHHLRGASIGSGVGAPGLGHAYRSSFSSMHTSVGSITTSDSFLEPHQPSSSISPSPPSQLRSQFQHQHYRQPGIRAGSVASSSVMGSPPRFSEAYGSGIGDFNSPSPLTSSGRPTSNHYQTPSPEYRRSWFSAFRTPVSNNDTKNSNSNSGRWGRTIQRRESSSSIASSETVSSSSTNSECDSPNSRKGSPTTACAAATPGMTVNTGSTTSDTGSFSSIPITSPQQPARAEKKYSSGDLSTMMTMPPPPPAYVSRRCEDMKEDMAKVMMGANEKALHLLQQDGQEKVIVVLPEIAPLGDFMSEFAVDFGAIGY
ncbi:hypothetical protein BGZ47_003060 [Haplosporangium gracile]|nr:hypothetical protein BGZ47_003060 [Haplosporangium gracile]